MSPWSCANSTLGWPLEDAHTQIKGRCCLRVVGSSLNIWPTPCVWADWKWSMLCQGERIKKKKPKPAAPRGSGVGGQHCKLPAPSCGPPWAGSRALAAQSRTAVSLGQRSSVLTPWELRKCLEPAQLCFSPEPPPCCHPGHPRVGAAPSTQFSLNLELPLAPQVSSQFAAIAPASPFPSRGRVRKQTTETVFLFQGQMYLNNLQSLDSLKGWLGFFFVWLFGFFVVFFFCHN